MTYAESFILGIVQGLTEFLPISSTGHLALFYHFFNIPETPLFFTVSVHIGTLISVFIFFRHKLINLIKNFFKGDPESLFMVKALVIASIPTAIIGIRINDFVENTFGSFLYLGLGFGMNVVFLIILNRLSKTEPITKETEQDNQFTFNKKPSLLDLLFIGIMQGVSILPSVSRSGATIFAGKIRGLSLTNAFEFSFLLSIPAILGAELLQFTSDTALTHVPQSIIGTCAAAFFGYIALGFLKKLLLQKKMMYFAWYCGVLSLISLFLAFS